MCVSDRETLCVLIRDMRERTCVSWSVVCECVHVSHHKCSKGLIAPSSVVKCADRQRGLCFIYLIHGFGI